ncbi:pentatricopeptide repeat-containing protein At5g39350-like [Wolffia australiana]
MNGALLRALARTREPAKAELLHGRLMTAGLLAEGRRRRQFLPRITAAYAISGAAPPARRLFDDLPDDQRTSFLFNLLIRAHLRHGLPLHALHLFELMAASPSLSSRPDNFTFTFAIKACADLALLRGGAQLHAAAVAGGLAADGFVQNSLLAMYLAGGAAVHAAALFDEMPRRSTVSWNTMIAGLARGGDPARAAALFDEMAAPPDSATATAVLPACAALGDLARGRRLHRLARRLGFSSQLTVRNALVDMYAKAGSLAEARRVFEEPGPRDVVTWTAMIGGCVLNGEGEEAIGLFSEMVWAGERPNSVTLVGLLAGCGERGLGRALHGSGLRRGLVGEVAAETALIAMYAACGLARAARSVLRGGSRSTATWNAAMASFPREAAALYVEMRRAGAAADAATWAALLPACADAADLRQARGLHGQVVRGGLGRVQAVGTGLVGMYAKAGSRGAARRVFEEMPERDGVAWGAVINGYAAHGFGREAAAMVEEMAAAGEEPGEVALCAAVVSCGRAGLVEDGMAVVRRGAGWGRCCAGGVDLLGRAGRLEEARRLAGAAPAGAEGAAWGALLGACVVHGSAEVGEEAARRAMEAEPENAGNYVLLGNLYAAVGRWEEAERVRRMVKTRGLKKLPGCSYTPS